SSDLLRADPDLARHRLTGRSTDRLDTATRADRPSGAQMGTETAPTPVVLGRCPHHPPRPPHAAAPVSQRAVVRPDCRCDRPADSTTSTDLTSTKPTNRDERPPCRTSGTRTPTAVSGQPPHACPREPAGKPSSE